MVNIFLAIASGIVVGLVTIFLFHINLYFGIGCGIGTAIFWGFCLHETFPNEINTIKKVKGVDRKQVLVSINNGLEKIETIREFSSVKPFLNSNFAPKINNICDIADRIFDTFRENPQNLSSAHKFITFYLDSSYKIISKFAELSEKGNINSNTINKFNDCLDNIYKVYTRQYDNLKYGDISGLEIEINVFKQMASLDNINLEKTK